MLQSAYKYISFHIFPWKNTHFRGDESLRAGRRISKMRRVSRIGNGTDRSNFVLFAPIRRRPLNIKLLNHVFPKLWLLSLGLMCWCQEKFTATFDNLSLEVLHNLAQKWENCGESLFTLMTTFYLLLIEHKTISCKSMDFLVALVEKELKLKVSKVIVSTRLDSASQIYC